MKKRRFRVAFSFSGEKRDYIANVSEILSERFGRGAILYDHFHQAEFARADLGIELPDLYFKETDLVVVVISKGYKRSQWCGLEWGAIHALIKERHASDVMLCRFGEVSVKGLYSTAGFVNLDEKTCAQAADLILQRLKKGRATSRPTLVKSVVNIRNSLPRLASFFGREKELKNIADALSPKTRSWGVLIDGPGGMGKTSLAIRAAEMTPPGQFRHVLFLSSKERTMTADGQRKLSEFVVPGYLEMLNQIAILIKKPDLTTRSESGRARSLVEALASTQTLLILDNLESLPNDQQSRLFEFLSQLPPGCKAIATSRRRTDVDARIIRLANMEEDAALRLLSEMSLDSPELARSGPSDRRQLFEESGGNPLLLRWIVGQLGKGHCRTVASALQFLRKVPPENDPLEFIFGDLLEAFSDNETKVLASLSYFTQTIETKHIAELSKLSRSAAEITLGNLANRALVVPSEKEDSFLLAPLVADFLRRKRPGIVAKTASRLEDIAYALIVENGYRKNAPFAMLDAEWPRVAAALPLFLSGSNDRLQEVCRALVHFLDFTGRWDERLNLYAKAERIAAAAGDYARAGKRAYQVAMVHYRRSQLTEMEKWISRAEENWGKAKPDTRRQADLLRLKALRYFQVGDYPKSIKSHKEALSLYKTISPESRDIAICLNSIAENERVSGHLEKAERCLLEALRVAKIVGEQLEIATCTGDLADFALDRKDWIKAESLARAALLLSEKLGRQRMIASDCRRVAEALVRQGKRRSAVEYARKAVEIHARLDSSSLEEAQIMLRECEG